MAAGSSLCTAAFEKPGAPTGPSQSGVNPIGGFRPGVRYEARFRPGQRALLCPMKNPHEKSVWRKTLAASIVMFRSAFSGRGPHLLASGSALV
ncbi:hypothetical protein KL86PLE_10236 [uncultured Pleomorphomonas sp.]|uniref:Uncharacterized protein n=1 Tax=uncultured Pleomorphomonas sp. TaxID=442121 RepID=A0A212KZH6_9HYPH|nr:hypothetical protein KL86PLE_10236 [uncultured Pleomorphomonas sp.]